jgi:hypothetical protein
MIGFLAWQVMRSWSQRGQTVSQIEMKGKTATIVVSQKPDSNGPPSSKT